MGYLRRKVGQHGTAGILGETGQGSEFSDSRSLDCLGSRVHFLGFRAQGSGLRISGSGFSLGFMGFKPRISAVYGPAGHDHSSARP